MRLATALPVLACVLLLAACGARHSVRVDPAPPRSGGTTAPQPRQYFVVRGDTLYGIAFRHGMDYRDLARLNGIRAPYTIFPGQRLELTAAAGARRPPAVATRPASGSAGGVVAPIVSTPRGQSAPSRGSAASPAPTRAAPADSASAAGGKPATATPASARPAAPPPALPSGPVRWRWPADGTLLSSYSAADPTRQGINIGGEAGHPVRAAGDGVVVYSGAGLIGYGELVIIKHSDEWLSAYGHNRKRLVNEGERVAAGQQIAEMGRSGASRDMLHFEIRRNGKPVDPQGLLPKR